MILDFDSRTNYQKILDSGSVSITTNTYPASATVALPIATKPNVKIWVQTSSGKLVPPITNTLGVTADFYNDVDTAIDEVSFSVDSDRLKINLYSFDVITRTIYYRIYADAD